MTRTMPKAATGRVTLQTIADALGVSRTTVSNAYSRPDQLAPALRARIMETADALGYGGPDAAARSLRRGRAGAIGLVFTESLPYMLSDPYAVDFLQGLAAAAEAHHAGLLLTSVAQQAGVDTVADAIVDGFTVFCLQDDAAAAAAIRRRGLPLVQTRRSDLPGAMYVAIDERGAAYAAARHVLDHGHRRVAVVADCFIPDGQFGPMTREQIAAFPDSDVGARLTGYLDAAATAGLDATDVVVVRADGNGVESGRSAGRRIVAADPRPTAVLAITDLLAIGVREAALEAGLVPGRDLSITGFDDVPDAARADLTTVRQPGREKGRRAGELLLDPPADPADGRVVLPTELVVRGSTGPALR